jgi:hypothetical protein
MKFKINLSPVRSDEIAPLLLKQGALLTVNSEEFDFGFLADGDTLPSSAIISEHFCSDVTRTGDTIELTIRLPHGPDAPESVRFPQPILVEQDGLITLPGETNVD